MSRLFALKYENKWFVSATRLSNYARVCGEGCSLPAAYLDYLRVVDKEEKHNKACVAEEARIVELIKRKSGVGGYVPEMDMLPEEFYGSGKRWWQFWR